MSKTIWSDAEAQLRPIMSNGLIDLPSNSKFSVKDLNYNFDKIINVNNAINNLNEIKKQNNNKNIDITREEKPEWINKGNADLTNMHNAIVKGKVEASGVSSGSAVQILTWEATD